MAVTCSCSHPVGCPGGVSKTCQQGGCMCVCSARKCKCWCDDDPIEGLDMSVEQEPLTVNDTFGFDCSDFKLFRVIAAITFITGIYFESISPKHIEKKITLKVDNAPLTEIIAQIERLSGAHIKVKSKK
jgi:hypothetical protein